MHQNGEEHSSSSAGQSSITGHQGPSNTVLAEATRPRSSSTASNTSTTSSITSLFESSLALLGSLPVATGGSSSSSSSLLPAKPIVHKSFHHGDFKLYLSQVHTFEDIQLQSHLLWPSSPKLAELMEGSDDDHHHQKIGIEGETVLELGAGSALLSLLAARMKASQATITDYPSPGILDAIRKNVECNLDEEERSRVSVSALDWTDELALRLMSEKYPEGFTKILAADTLWMGHLNKSQIKVMTTLLSRTSNARVCLVAGLHTGRHVIRSFLEECILQGLEIETAEEVDRLNEAGIQALNWKKVVEENVNQEEIVEGIEEERRRWLVYAVLKWPREVTT